MKLSIICIYNNRKQLDECFLKSLKFQKMRYELILVDGSNGNFKSCAQALNHAASLAKGEILIFSHQDIYLKNDNSLLEITKFIESKPSGTVVGVAGAREGRYKNIGNYTSGLNIVFDSKKCFDKEIEVSCIDECFFGMKNSTYIQHYFDEQLCDNWHLYAVEQCLYHRSKGDKIYVFPLEVHHLSSGKINLKYMDGLIALANSYEGKIKYIWTTCYKVRCSVKICKTLRFLWLLNRRLRRREY